MSTVALLENDLTHLLYNDSRSMNYVGQDQLCVWRGSFMLFDILHTCDATEGAWAIVVVAYAATVANIIPNIQKVPKCINDGKR